MVNQQDLAMACDSIEAYQQNMDTELKLLDEALNREIATLENQQPTKDDMERENIGKMVENLDQSLAQMEETLTKLSEDYNKTMQGNNRDGSDNPIEKVCDRVFVDFKISLKL